MYLPQFKLSKLAAGIGSVLWWMAYAPQLQAQPRQIAPMIPLASTWPAYGQIAARDFAAFEARVLAAQDANPSSFVRAWRDAHPEIAETWRRTTYEGRAEGGPLSSNLPRNVPAATGRPLTDADVDAMAEACRGGSVCDCSYCIEQQREACEQSAREFNASVARCKAAGCSNAPDGPGPHYCGSSGGLPVATNGGKGAYIEGPDAWPCPPHSAGQVERAKPKRVRVRAKPLTAADIVVGGEYVPKRGNNKTPNFVVVSVSDDGSRVVWRRTDESKAWASAGSATEFLALAARRVNA